eukprot:TRINITY_DN2929_c0_g1_i3.p2 TRINITY_DN2929_c0_g1~~TRINITY_DN2929_c0_g1_i3.p2  ORF type:complete len:273 (-),score=48.89 TRINITY_DN2929_c0_g1_i3:1029-1847(-)
MTPTPPPALASGLPPVPPGGGWEDTVVPYDKTRYSEDEASAARLLLGVIRRFSTQPWRGGVAVGSAGGAVGSGGGAGVGGARSTGAAVGGLARGKAKTDRTLTPAGKDAKARAADPPRSVDSRGRGRRPSPSPLKRKREGGGGGGGGVGGGSGNGGSGGATPAGTTAAGAAAGAAHSAGPHVSSSSLAAALSTTSGGRSAGVGQEEIQEEYWRQPRRWRRRVPPLRTTRDGSGLQSAGRGRLWRLDMDPRYGPPLRRRHQEVRGARRGRGRG